MSAKRAYSLVVSLAFAFTPAIAQDDKPNANAELRDFVEIVKLEKRGKNDDLVASCEQFLRRYPTSIAEEIVRLALGKALWKEAEQKSEYDRAIQELTTFIEKFPRSALLGESYLLRGESFRLTNKHSQSIPDFRRAYELCKESGDNSEAAHAQYHLAYAYYHVRDKAKAKEEMQALKHDFPNSPFAKNADALLSLLVKKPATTRSKGGTIETGAPALDFSAKDIEGNEISLKKYRGKVVLLDFWATWCGPCRAELPNVKRVYDKYKDKGFAVIGISLDRDLKKLKAFIAEEGIEWPQIFDGKGWDNKVAQLYGVQAIPATYLVDRKGVLTRIGLRGEALQDVISDLVEENAGKK